MPHELGVTQKTVMFLAQRIPKTWIGGNSDKIDGQAQVDETYVGGKEKNKHAGRGVFGKIAVVGMCDESGQVRAKPARRTDAATLVGMCKRTHQSAVKASPTNPALTMALMLALHP